MKNKKVLELWFNEEDKNFISLHNCDWDNDAEYNIKVQAARQVPLLIYFVVAEITSHLDVMESEAIFNSEVNLDKIIHKGYLKCQKKRKK